MWRTSCSVHPSSSLFWPLATMHLHLSNGRTGYVPTLASCSGCLQLLEGRWQFGENPFDVLGLGRRGNLVCWAPIGEQGPAPVE